MLLHTTTILYLDLRHLASVLYCTGLESTLLREKITGTRWNFKGRYMLLPAHIAIVKLEKFLFHEGRFCLRVFSEGFGL